MYEFTRKKIASRETGYRFSARFLKKYALILRYGAIYVFLPFCSNEALLIKMKEIVGGIVFYNNFI